MCVIHHTVILQPLGHVNSLDVSRLLERPHVQNELVGDKTYKTLCGTFETLVDSGACEHK